MGLLKKAVAIAPLLAPLAVFAQSGSQPLPSSQIDDPGQALDLLCTVAGWIFAFLIVLAVIFVLLAAFNYLTASGDSEKVSKANSQLIYAAVAVAVALFARGFPLLVSGFLDASGVTSCS